MNPTIDIVVIGHLSRNPHWGEQQPVRPPVATTTLIRSGETTILVDPSLPPEMLAGRLHERSGLTPDKIDLVFLTSFHPTHRRGLPLFDDAKWLIGEEEKSVVADHLNAVLDRNEPATADVVDAELALLGRTEAAEDSIALGVDLFPCFGVTPGQCGLLVAGLHTTVITGDAVLTRTHFEHSQVSEDAVDAEQARTSLAELYEIADQIVPGHDNIFSLPGRM